MLGGRAAGAALACVVLAGALALGGCRAVPDPLPPAGVKVHTVKKGETIWRISQRYDTTVGAIQRANKLGDPTRIQIGQRLLVPLGLRVPESWTRSDARGRTLRTVFRWPLEGELTSTYGVRDGAHHDGIDISAPRGTEVRAIESGRVIHSDASLKGYGNMVIVKHSGRYSSVYAHNRRNLVRVGDFVERGDVIAEVGRTGRASSPHLHLEIRRDGKARNPLDFLR